LEDAFIELGNNKKHEEAQTREQLYANIFADEYSTNFLRLAIAHSYRRFALMFTNPVLILKFFCASFLPPILIYASQGGKPLTILNVYMVPGGTVLIFLFIISFFAHLPWEERKFRLRYILKMLGTDTFTYYANMLICDTIYLTIIVILNFTLLFVFNLQHFSEVKDILFNAANLFYTSQIIIYTIFWGLSFICMSYLMQYALPSTREGVGLVPIYIFAINASVLPISFFMSIAISMTAVASGDVKTIKSSIFIYIFVCTLISPAVGLAGMIVVVLYGDLLTQAMNQTNDPNVITVSEITTVLLTPMALNPILYLLGAVIVDFW